MSSLLSIFVECETLMGVLILFVLNSASGDPNPVMTFPDSGVYSLFPNEDLRTGKSSRTFQERNERFQDQFPRTRDNSIINGHAGRVFFDDERLNFRGHFDSRDQSPPFQRGIYSDRNERFPFIPVLPAYGEAKLPPIRPNTDEPTRVHVFNPEIPQHAPPPRSLSLDDSEEDGLRAGRILLPPRNPFLNLREPGPDAFLNHDEFLDYHTKAAIASLQSIERRRPCKKTESRHLLFSSSISDVLVPPSSSSSSSSTESSSTSTRSSTESIEPEVRSLENGKIHITSLLDSEKRRSSSRLETLVTRPILENGFIPIRIQMKTNDGEELPRTLPPPPQSTIPSLLVETGRTDALPTEAGTIEIRSTTTATGRVQYPYVKKSPTFSPGHITRIQQRPFPVVSTLPPTTARPFFKSKDNNKDDSEMITFSPNTFDDFIGRRTNSEFSATKIRTEVPLIFLESQQELERDKEKNAIFVKRLKNTKNYVKDDKVNTKSKLLSIQSTVTVHSPELSSTETQGRPLTTSDEIKGQRSTSLHGVVAKVHAHVSHCPKLYTAAEVICDVHIRKRHGTPNPQLTVGWKRKFQNATKEDVVLAINTTLAYIEEDFHDKFNVTLAPGISPMLRSVLSIRYIQPSDTGNYECQVNDGQNQLKSDTLLFLCH